MKVVNLVPRSQSVYQNSLSSDRGRSGTRLESCMLNKGLVLSKKENLRFHDPETTLKTTRFRSVYRE